MPIIICPGIHEADLTKSFVQGCLNQDNAKSVDIDFAGESY